MIPPPPQSLNLKAKIFQLFFRPTQVDSAPPSGTDWKSTRFRSPGDSPLPSRTNFNVTKAVLRRHSFLASFKKNRKRKQKESKKNGKRKQLRYVMRGA